MGPVSEITQDSDGVVALLLDDLAPPRLGTLLRGARKRGSLSRREVAGRTGTTPGELRRYERGNAPVPASVIAALAECYGSDLTSQLATRAPVDLDTHRIVVGAEVAQITSEDENEVLEKYVHLVQRVRRAQPGEPIGLRADDLVALSGALDHDTEHVEARIAELLGCSPREARSLHAEMLRRKLVVPVAGLVTGLAVVTGVGVAAAATGSSHSTPAHHPAAHSTPAPAHASTAPSTTVAAKPAVVANADAAPDVTTAPATAAPPVNGTATAPEIAPAPQTPTTEAPAPAVVTPAVKPLPRPVITTDTTPVSIPGPETVTIIQP